MHRHHSTRRTFAGLAGLFVGLAVGVTLGVFSNTALGNRFAGASIERRLEATHLPPLLTTPGEQVELRYDVYCLGGDESGESSCEATGTAFVRPGESGSFVEIPLIPDPSASEGRYVARVSEATRSTGGFSYYAAFEDPESGATVTIPIGGASAPQRSLPLDGAVEIELGAHVFGATRRADARVAGAAWGDGPQHVGLEQGRQLPPIGASSFDVAQGGTVLVLDQAHRRVLRWRRGSSTPVLVPVSIAGTLADMSLAPDGTIYVLESVVAPGHSPLVRRFDSYGRELEAFDIAERTSSQIRIGPDGPVVLQHPSSQWMPVASGGSPLGADAQGRQGRSGRLLPGGREIVVLRQGNEIRVTLRGTNGVRRSWRVTSETPLAEVQLAQPFGSRLVVVVRVYTDTRDEFVALVLSEGGLVRRFSLDSADWAETAPLTRFRLAGSSLYQLGSTPAGVFVDRFDLEVK